MHELDRESLRDLLVRGWMTHDAMWFRHLVAECGIEVANRVNLAAVRSMAAIEIRRLVKAYGLGEVRTMADVEILFAAAWESIRGDFMEFRYHFPGGNVMRWEVDRCFAFDGVSRLGVAAEYRCGIYPRVEAWLDALEIPYTADPELDGCLMYRHGACAREYRFSLPATAAG